MLPEEPLRVPLDKEKPEAGGQDIENVVEVGKILQGEKEKEAVENHRHDDAVHEPVEYGVDALPRGQTLARLKIEGDRDIGETGEAEVAGRAGESSGRKLEDEVPRVGLARESRLFRPRFYLIESTLGSRDIEAHMVENDRKAWPDDEKPLRRGHLRCQRLRISAALRLGQFGRCKGEPQPGGRGVIAHPYCPVGDGSEPGRIGFSRNFFYAQPRIGLEKKSAALLEVHDRPFSPERGEAARGKPMQTTIKSRINFFIMYKRL